MEFDYTWQVLRDLPGVLRGKDEPMILRISFRPERPAEQIQAELHF